MQQQTFTDVEYAGRRASTRRDRFLETMDRLLPWKEWIAMIEPYYPYGKRGKPARSVETMLRMLLLKEWFGLSAAGVEEAVSDSYAMRSFMRIDFTSEQVPDSSTLLKFRRLLEKKGLKEKVLTQVSEILQREGLTLRSGTIVEASLGGATGRKRRKTVI